MKGKPKGRPKITQISIQNSTPPEIVVPSVMVTPPVAIQEEKKIPEDMKTEGIKIGIDRKTLDPNFEIFQLWEDLKIEPDKFYYRGLNVRPVNLNKKKAIGYEVVPGQENPIGDLILGRLPKEARNLREKRKDEKIKRMEMASKGQFEEQMRRHKVPVITG